MKTKATNNTAGVVETSARKTKLHAELGKLTFEIAKLKQIVNEKGQRSNEIANELEKLNG